jgi:DNA topoisomerase-2
MAPAKPAAKKSASEMYQKVSASAAKRMCSRTDNSPQLSQLEHVLKRPDTYIGSVEAHTQDMWVLDPETKDIVNR